MVSPAGVVVDRGWQYACEGKDVPALSHFDLCFTGFKSLGCVSSIPATGVGVRVCERVAYVQWIVGLAEVIVCLDPSRRSYFLFLTGLAVKSKYYSGLKKLNSRWSKEERGGRRKRTFPLPPAEESILLYACGPEWVKLAAASPWPRTQLARRLHYCPCSNGTRLAWNSKDYQPQPMVELAFTNQRTLEADIE